MGAISVVADSMFLNIMDTELHLCCTETLDQAYHGATVAVI